MNICRATCNSFLHVSSTHKPKKTGGLVMKFVLGLSRRARRGQNLRDIRLKSHETCLHRGNSEALSQACLPPCPPNAPTVSP